jgi:hypothetical protein
MSNQMNNYYEIFLNLKEIFRRKIKFPSSYKSVNDEELSTYDLMDNTRSPPIDRIKAVYSAKKIFPSITLDAFTHLVSDRLIWDRVEKSSNLKLHRIWIEPSCGEDLQIIQLPFVPCLNLVKSRIEYLNNEIKMVTIPVVDYDKIEKFEILRVAEWLPIILVSEKLMSLIQSFEAEIFDFKEIGISK